MSTVSIESVATQPFPELRAEVGQGARLGFAACATMLITFAFMMPIRQSWEYSTYEGAEIRDGRSTSEGNVGKQIGVGILGLFGVAALIWPGGKALRVRGVLGAFCAAYVAWCAASLLWSDDFSLSMRRGIALMCELTAAVAIAKWATPRQFVWIVFACAFAWLGLGVLAELSLGTFRPWQPGYRFCGIFHPNLMGVNCALLIMSSNYLGGGAQGRNRLFILIAGIALVFLLLTGSRTTLAALIAAYAFRWFIMAPPLRVAFSTLAVGVTTGCLMLALGLGMFGISADWAAMGREDHDMASLTGRVPLWHELIESYAGHRPILGHGYGAFWSADRIAELSASQNWQVPHAHSIYIDLFLNTGLIGAFLCLSAMVMAVFSATRREAQHARAGYGFIAMIVVFGLSAGLLETYVGITWFLSFFGICGMCYLALGCERDSGHHSVEEFV